MMTPVPFSLTDLTLISLPLVAALAVYISLHRRWANPTGEVALDEWRREHWCRLRRPPFAKIPEPLDDILIERTLSPVLTLRDRQLCIVQAIDDTGQTWHLAVRLTGAAWTPRALRPAKLNRGLADLTNLHYYCDAAPSDRFYVFASHYDAAQALADSVARGLVPPDIGLMLTGPYIVIDFSDRPFDPTELSRVRALANQLAKMLPAA